MNKALVAFAALMFTCFGAIGLVDPSRSLALIHLSAVDTTSINEIRAMYGGVELGIAAFLIAALAGLCPLRSALLLVATVFGGAAVGRATSMVVDGMPATEFAVAVVVEAIVCLLAVVAWKREGAPTH
jgi:hypothetical protein